MLILTATPARRPLLTSVTPPEESWRGRAAAPCTPIGEMTKQSCSSRGCEGSVDILTPLSGWPALLRNTRNVGDFINWKDQDSYQRAFERLLRDLKAEA